MLAHLVAFGGEHHAVAVFYRQPQLQGVDGIQTQAIAKECRIGVNVVSRQFFQIQRSNYEIFNFKIERLHH